ncbi:hypothetical protein MYAM1_004095 [Malassezia yamatoensis]|uniref:Uncharacterized protein n=1 Tax=Malassezia yamatoensis TaxID=253288 RepID=A0AAJ5Z160_9BASI|nr:hypothetical protein MYAM1_004095 [Malassezia yamatoensis]
MLCYQFLSAVALALVSITQAAPLTTKPIQCKAVGHPSKLVSYVPEKKHNVYFGSESNAKHPKLLGSKSSDEQFQFYECTPPNDQYRGAKAGRTSGQVRSVKHPDLCLTPNDVIKYVPHTNDGSINSETIPRGKDGTITLEPCATTDSEIMRRQWLGLKSSVLGQHCKLPKVVQLGRKGDLVLSSLDGNSTKSSFYFPFRKGDAFAYLANDIPKNCRGEAFQ